MRAKSVVDVVRRDGIVVADLGDDENLLTVERLESLLALLDDMASGGRGRALVTTASGRFYSAGLDLEDLEDASSTLRTLRLLEQVYARLMALPVPTLAVIPGHAFAGGAMLALAHDVRVMRSERGYWCLPEVGLGMPLTEGMIALVAARAPALSAHEAVVTGRRYAAEDALTAGLVDVVAPPDELLDTAMDIAERRLSTAGPALGQMKRLLHAAAIDLLETGTTVRPADLLTPWPTLLDEEIR